MEVNNFIGSGEDIQGHFCKVHLIRCSVIINKSNSSSISGAGMTWNTQTGSPGMYAMWLKFIRRINWLEVFKTCWHKGSWRQMLFHFTHWLGHYPRVLLEGFHLLSGWPILFKYWYFPVSLCCEPWQYREILSCWNWNVFCSLFSL